MTVLKKLTYNERRIVNSLRSSGLQNRLRLAHDLGLTPPTITRLITNLLQYELLSEHVDQSSNVKKGFPSKLLDINPEAIYSAGVYFDPDYIYTCVCDLVGNMVIHERQEVADRSFESIMNLSAESITRHIKSAGIDPKKVAGVGVSYPGHYTPDPNRVFRIKQFESWPDVDISKDLSPYFDFPVFHMNESTAAVLGEHYYGASRNFSNFCIIRLSYGIGGSVILNQQLYLGKNKDAAEFGGIFPKSQPRPSGQDLIDTLRATGHSINRLSEVNKEHLSLPEMQNWRDRSTEQVRWLCLVIARMYDPEAIVISGTLPNALLAHFVRAIASPTPLGEDFTVTPPKIVRATKDNFPQRGAAALPIYNFFSPDTFSGSITKGR